MRTAAAILLASLFAAIAILTAVAGWPTQAGATPGAWGAVYGSSFTPVGHTQRYAGAGTVSGPSGASTVVVEACGASGGGQGANTNLEGGGGATGGYAKKTLSVSAADWGKTFTFTVGALGYAGSPPQNGGATSVANGTFSLTLALSALGGQRGQRVTSSAGGTAGGGDVNTTGATGDPGTTDGLGGAPTAGVAITCPGGGNGAPIGGVPVNTNGGAGAVAFSYS